MRLTSIQMSGFKSFVEPTRVIFDSALTGVVGPNGCGKSNIIDAVRWALGESARNIRGESLDDIIFDGSESRKRLDQASIEMVVDNSAGRIGGQYASYSEIRIRREVSREMEHQSRYYINNVHVRRKDVSELFQGTGLGRGNYAIIAQGMVQGLIEAKPDTMRKYIEEAAGISLYRERRRETENRIRHTKENLDRLQDILKDHEKQLQHLKKQKDQAKKSRALEEELQIRKSELTSLKWREENKILQRLKEKYAEAEERRTRKDDRVQDLKSELARKEDACDAARKAHEREVGEYHRWQSEANSLEQAIGFRTNQRDQARADRERLKTEIRELEESETKLERELRQFQEEQQKAQSSRTEIGATLEQARARKAKQEDDLRQCRDRVEALSEQLRAAEKEDAEEQARRRHIEEELQHRQEAGGMPTGGEDLRTVLREKCEAMRAAAQQHKDRLEENRQKIQQARQRLRDHAEAFAGVKDRQAQARNRLAALEALQQASLSADPQSHAQALQKLRLQGKRLMDLIEVESGWEFAVETVLADRMGAFCVEKLPAAVAEERVPGASPLMLLNLSALAAHKPDRMVLSGRIKSPFSLESQLGGVLAAENLEQAYTVRSALLPHQSVITQSGVWLGPDWVRLPALESQEEGALERQREKGALDETLKQLDAQFRETERQAQAAEQELQREEARTAELQAESDRAFEAYANGKARLEGLEGQSQRLGRLQEDLRRAQSKQQQCRQQIETLKKESDRAGAARREAEEAYTRSNEEIQRQESGQRELQMQASLRQDKIESHQQDLSRARDGLKHRRMRWDGLPQSSAADTEEAEMKQERDKKREKERQAEQRMRETRTSLETLEAGRKKLQAEYYAQDQQLKELGQEAHKRKMEQQQAQNTCEQLEGELRLDGCAPEEVLEKLPEDADIERWDEKVQKVHRRIEKLPPVNYSAEADYDELQQRKEKEEEQMSDVQQALDKLNRAMLKIDRETRDRFRDTFSRVNENLKKMFPRIIGKGGEANLEMAGDNLLEAGVEVRARPPGKRYRNMHMLSGGEQAMVAVSLVLSLFILNPAPFCILDEVDAPLSDDNLFRFCQILGEMSEQVQFIIVTHNKTTMEHVEQLVGVTMNEPGVSRLVSVNVAQAMEMIEQEEAGHA